MLKERKYDDLTVAPPLQNEKATGRSHKLRVASLSGAIVVMLVVTFFLAARPVAAESELGLDDHCSPGDAAALQNAFLPLFQQGDNSPDDIARRCQFRTYFEPAEGICFCEDDEFIGGIVDFDVRDDPEFLEWTARESVSLMEITLSVIDPDGMPLDDFVTPVMGGIHNRLGWVSWKQAGATFKDLPPGDYTLLTEFDHPSEAIYGDIDPIEVTFHVLSHEEAHDLGRPVSGLAGSVTCPPERG